ncbi:glycerol-3-phosphate dehydrogenase/oxidase [Stieleria varia]|uniref:Aerobic glycerol-3-phosphate dehydrogenase n=1 Tax=Stieleria varia TaxID=2528005 RepID=A0A5C6A1C9_9BACT|nr:glycerol-3-phosphate dehydrogenase/oxidase [Stieleria varia]TWT93226.1 Aerobic glycerol-3-phosphate dehydrogenase [Stieleria varia]
MSAVFQRDDAIQQIRQRVQLWDLVVIGGGATGIGIALDAASRGMDVLLLEQSDFGKGTSSRSTKLVHGGVRYLQQGNITLVRDALRERTLLRNNAPHLVHDMEFVIPCTSLWQRFFYGFGLKIYDLLATGNSFGRSHGASNTVLDSLVPELQQDGLRGGVVYHDGQFDDARLLINMAQTAAHKGAWLANYVGVTGMLKQDNKIIGVTATDAESGDTYSIQSRCVVNAAGPFCDAVRSMDDVSIEPMIAPSQGVHVVLPKSFFPGPAAMIVPKTSDGRVIFIIPWHDHTLIGTTDTAIKYSELEPSAQTEEIEFLLQTAAIYLKQTPTHDDILSVFTGIRPLVKGDKSARTASLSRDHVIRTSPSGLITITGGKWTTVRKMAEDCVDHVVEQSGITVKDCQTKQMHLHGFCDTHRPASRNHYGSDLASIEQLESERPELSEMLHPQLTIRKSEVVWAVLHEMSRTVEDFLSRRSRALFLNAHAAIEIAPLVAQIMATELGKDEPWRDKQVEHFNETATHFLPPTTR